MSLTWSLVGWLAVAEVPLGVDGVFAELLRYGLVGVLAVYLLVEKRRSDAAAVQREADLIARVRTSEDARVAAEEARLRDFRETMNANSAATQANATELRALIRELRGRPCMCDRQPPRDTPTR